MNNDIKQFMQLVESIQDEEVVDTTQLSDAVKSYLMTALWSSTDTHPETGDSVELDNFVFDDECKVKLSNHIVDFIKKYQQLVLEFMEQEKCDIGQFAHSLWLSEQGHGSGFFDFSGEAARQLNDLVSNSSEKFNLYLGDDLKVHC